jgi:hypothetical protein
LWCGDQQFFNVLHWSHIWQKNSKTLYFSLNKLFVSNQPAHAYKTIKQQRRLTLEILQLGSRPSGSQK